jgi:hypothetical protein
VALVQPCRNGAPSIEVEGGTSPLMHPEVVASLIGNQQGIIQFLSYLQHISGFASPHF